MKHLVFGIAPVLFVLGAVTTPLAADEAPDTRREDRGPTALIEAVERGDRDAVDRLLSAGASPDAADRLGETALHTATARPLAFTDRLLAAGANVDARDSGGVSVLMKAAGTGRKALVERLLNAGARLDIRDYQGSSATDWAERHGHGDLAQRLRARTAALQERPAAADKDDFEDDAFVDVDFPDWFKWSFLDLPVDLQEAMDAGKQGIMLFVSSSHCSYCKAFIDRSLGSPDIRQRLDRSFDVIGLELFNDSPMTAVDGTRYGVKDFITAQRAQLTPTLIFYGEGGEQLLKIVGYYPPDRFRRVLDYLESGRHQTLRDFMKQQRAGDESEALVGPPDNPLFADPPHILDRRAGPGDRPLMVVFEEAPCEPCARFHRRVLGDDAIRRLLAEYEVRRLDIGDPDSRVITPSGERLDADDWYRKLGLSYTPAVVLFDQKGREALRIDSETLDYRMEGSLQLVLENTHLQDAQLQRWRRDKAVQALTVQRAR